MKSIIDFFRHLFVPNEKNNYRSKAIHIDFLTYYLIFAIFINFFIKKTNLSSILGYATDITINKLYLLTNEERTKNNLPPLNYNQNLALAAELKAKDMFEKNYWAHYAPDGTAPWNFILKANYKYEYAGENLAKNFLFSSSVINAWMNSPSHRENILKKEYTDVGFAVVNGILNGEETTLVVQMFGKPLMNYNTVQAQESSSKEIFNQQKKITTNKITKPIKESLTKKNQKLQPAILAKSQHVLVNFNYLFLSFIIIALIIDLYFSIKLKIIRISGKNLAHIIFISFIIIGLGIIINGSIL